MSREKEAEENSERKQKGLEGINSVMFQKRRGGGGTTFLFGTLAALITM